MHSWQPLTSGIAKFQVEFHDNSRPLRDLASVLVPTRNSVDRNAMFGNQIKLALCSIAEASLIMFDPIEVNRSIIIAARMSWIMLTISPP